MRWKTGTAVILLSLTCHLAAGNWPQWRGPDANGVSPETGIPVRWRTTQNVLWRASLQGLGTSSPIVWKDQIFLTSQVGRGRVEQGGGEFRNARVTGRGGEEDGRVYFFVQSFQRSDGRLFWEYRMEADQDLPSVHRKHNLASPTCVTDGTLVFAWFGTGQLVALDLDGRVVWKHHLGKEISPFDILWGHGSSPVLYEDSLILLCDHPPHSYLLALNKRTGKKLWEIERGTGLRSYSTPFVVRGKRDELIINTNQRIEALNPSTGRNLWHVENANRVPIPTPVFHKGVLYASRGYTSGPYMAIRTGGAGDVSETHVEWKVPTGAPYISSLLYYRGLLYLANERGIITCVHPDTGVTVWRKRLKGAFTASPVAAGGKIYLLNEDGETFVLQAGREPIVLERNPLDERSLASPAISDGQLFIRTDAHLFCISGP